MARRPGSSASPNRLPSSPPAGSSSTSSGPGPADHRTATATATLVAPDEPLILATALNMARSPALHYARDLAVGRSDLHRCVGGQLHSDDRQAGGIGQLD